MPEKGGEKERKEVTHLQKLQDIEQKVIESVEIAATVTEELSKIGETDKQKVAELCLQFINNIKGAQNLVKELTSGHLGEKKFEASSYLAMFKAHLAYEKVQVVSTYLESMQQVLKAPLPAWPDDPMSPVVEHMDTT